MKNLFLITALLVMGLSKSFAHFMWIETNATGKINTSQEVRVYFGEYGHDVREKVGSDTFNKMQAFTLWAIAPNGEKTKLTVTPADLYYKAAFTPKTNGTYTFVLDNDKIEVIDFTKYNFGIFKTHYHATAKTEVGSGHTASASANPNGLSISDISKKQVGLNGEITLKITYKNEPFAEKEIDLFIPNQWSRKVKTNKEGIITFKAPYKTQYLVEATHKEETPGTYNNKEYQFIWHSATYAIPF